MKYPLHWFRRDLHHHALATVLWVLLVALFTAARLWFRTHPNVAVSDRALWLNVSAGALGCVEVFILLAVMIDDPLRGSRAFWKTRPPSGRAVFGAKVIFILLLSVVIPGMAEAVFLFLAGPSGGTGVRVALFMVPPVLALMAGVTLLDRRSALFWLPAVLILTALAIMALEFVDDTWFGRGRYTDPRLALGTALGASILCGLVLWRSRSRYAAPVTVSVFVPLFAAGAVQLTGWPREPLMHTVPPGVDPKRVTVEWYRPGAYFSRYPAPGALVLPLRVSGLPENYLVRGWLDRVTIEITGGKKITPRRPRTEWFQYEWKKFEVWEQEWPLLLDEGEEPSAGKVSGTMNLFCYAREHHAVPLAGGGKITTPAGIWTFTPRMVPEMMRIECEWECVEPATFAWRIHAWIDHDSGFLVRKGEAGELFYLSTATFPETNFWEGIGRFSRGKIDASLHSPHADQPVWRLLWSAVTHPEEWQLECDTRVLAGKLEIPFTLDWPPGK